ncbi:tetratricopeptide repeat protein [Parvibaculum sp.]|uniref:tetratricopeptide repeat protein n=1 Tax=Parvibaculum sp. TaxID=2024848 RepID=UPI0027326012|nr:tetratricopeptide repeat protein [Parvibaculum sp.]MDP3327126.1 tetratricopeptide repeat protein [Parvibaculum sp.]
MKLFADQTQRSALRAPRSGWLALATLCSVIALSGCASTGTTPVAQASKEAAQARIDEPALRNAAIESTKTQDYVAAAAYWGALYERTPGDATTAVHYSKALRQIGSIEQSLTVMQRARIKFPENAEVLAEAGKALTASGRPDQGVAMLEAAALQSPKDWSIRSALGVALDQMGRYDEAKGRYNESLALSPDNPSVLTNLGLSYALTGDLDMAERTLRKAVADTRADAYARQNLAIVLGLKGNFDEAERLARADLPANVADGNMAYLRSMLSQPALWKQLEELDRQPEGTAPASPPAAKPAAAKESHAFPEAEDQVSSLPPETRVSIY